MLSDIKNEQDDTYLGSAILVYSIVETFARLRAYCTQKYSIKAVSTTPGINHAP